MTVVQPRFEWEVEVTGNDTAAPNGTLNLLAASGGDSAGETGLFLNTNGTIHFAPGQTFPGTGCKNHHRSHGRHRAHRRRNLRHGHRTSTSTPPRFLC